MRLKRDRIVPQCWVPIVVRLTLALALSIAPTFGQNWLKPDQRVEVDLSADLLTVDGKPVKISDFDERVLMVNFWATWCGPCRIEMPSIEALEKELSRKSFRILAITDEDPATVRAYLARAPYDFTILIDKNGILADRLRIWSIPMTLVLDSHRRLVHFHQGARPWDTPDIIENLRRLLSE
jgi:thiol-disulfide isomerase/thioredoxin